MIVVASERPVIQTVFDLPVTEVKELMPGQSIVVKRNGNMKVSTIHPAVEVTPCSFERIYFSRGSDCDIYNERKELGRLLTENILKSVGYDVDHTIFSFIPNTAEIAYYGMMQGLEAWLDRQKSEEICARNGPTEQRADPGNPVAADPDREVGHQGYQTEDFYR